MKLAPDDITCEGPTPEDKMSRHLSDILRTTRLFQELLLKLFFNKFPKSPKVSNTSHHRSYCIQLSQKI